MPNSKILVSFPKDPALSSDIWSGGNSCFQFTDISYECNNIISDTSPVKQQSSYYDISTNIPSIKLNCVKQGFDISNNYFIFIKNSNIIGYTLTEYLSAINNGIIDASNGGDIHITTLPASIDSTSYFNLNIDITKSIDQPNYLIDLSNNQSTGFLNNFNISNVTNTNIYRIYQHTATNDNTVDKTNSLSGLLLSGSQNIFDISFAYKSGYTFPNNSYLATIYGRGNGYSVSSDISYNIPFPPVKPDGYPYFYNELATAITNAFLNYQDKDGNTIFKGTTFVTEPSIIPGILSATLTIVINKYLTQNDYSIQFVDMVGSSSNEITDYRNVSWYKYLHIDPSMVDVSMNLNQTLVKSRQYINNTILSTNGSYKIITGNIPVEQAEIILNDKSCYFELIPFQDGVASSYNNIKIEIPYINLSGTPISYTRVNLLLAMNIALNNNAETKGSYIEIKTINGIEYTNIRLTINKIYSAKDYRVVFYDPYSFVKCYVGASSVQNTTWDATLGWILGYRDSVEYVLSEYGSGLDPINIVGDTTVSTNLYNYFLICLDDFNQNHLNDSLVTVTPRDTNIALPSYANPSNIICDPVTGQRAYNTLAVTDYTKLTNNQLYSITEIANSKNTVNPLRNSITSKSYSSGPYVQDVFALIPLRLSGLPNGAYYVDNGGSLQNQQRVYFGPINLSKMSIKLVDDRGNIVNLNNSNWSFSILCEMLYKPKPSG